MVLTIKLLKILAKFTDSAICNGELSVSVTVYLFFTVYIKKQQAGQAEVKEIFLRKFLYVY
jgi:hypothetical protein